MNEIMATPSPHTFETGCEGICKNCGKAHIKIMGRRDEPMKDLISHVVQALAIFPMKYRLIEVTEPNALQASGAKSFPALMLDGLLMSEGYAPTAQEIVNMFSNRYLFHSKLYRLRQLLVPVDMSDASANALRFAWQLARRTGSDLSVIHAMDSIFEGQNASASGFLSSYQHTMMGELNDFVKQTLHTLDADWTPDDDSKALPGTAGDTSPRLKTRVVYGYPDRAIEENAVESDLVVMSTTGRGSPGVKLFGSISTEVSKYSTTPVLFVPPGASFDGFKNILYASNFESIDSLRVRQAASFAQRFDSQIHFVHVGPALEEGIDTERKLFEVNYAQSGADKPFVFKKIIENSNVVGALYEYALFHRIELLVFVTHQRSFWENLLHQSITQKALLDGDLPTLVIHSDGDMI